MLEAWLTWAQRSRIPAFVELGRKIRKNLPGIEAAMLNKLSNTIVESTNTKLWVLTRMAYGFASPDALIAWLSSTGAATAHRFPDEAEEPARSPAGRAQPRLRRRLAEI